MDAKKFGVFIAETRKEKNMTQAELARKIQVSDKTISKWERGAGFPDINNIEPLADALELSILEIMKSERLDHKKVPPEAIETALSDTLDIAKKQRALSIRNAFTLCIGIIAGVGLFILGRFLYLQPDPMLTAIGQRDGVSSVCIVGKTNLQFPIFLMATGTVLIILTICKYLYSRFLHRT